MGECLPADVIKTQSLIYTTTSLQFLAVRKTLEANMQMADLFPPGRVFWALRDGDLHRAHRIGAGSGRTSPKDKVRLFEVVDVKKVFDQIIFARDMLSSHLPHQYDQVLHELL